jgi:chromosome partitioning protein
MRAVAIVNQKGGCGKTITAINLSAFLAREQRRVLLIDMDPQGHATLGLLRDTSQLQKTIYDVLTCEQDATPLGDIIVRVRENLDLAPADILLAALPEELAAAPGKENRLSEALEGIRQDYDYIIVDCPPSVGPLTFNALKVCSEAIIPVEPSFFSLHGIGMQMETLDLLARKAGHNIKARALITLYTGRSEFVKAVAEEIRRHLVDRSFNTVIRFSVKLAEAAGHGVPVAEFSTRSAGFADYRALTQEVLEQESPKWVSTTVEEVAEEASLPREQESPKWVSTTVEEVAEEASLPGALVEYEQRKSSLAPPMDASPPLRVEEGVLFTIEAPGARCVQLAADFNGWVAVGNEMQSSGSVWTKVVALPPGRYHYRYVVDGSWKTDPLNVNIEPTPWGGFNSVLDLEGNNPSHTEP